MRINAYILAAEPDWIEASIRSYYDLADRIVVCYDKDSLGWTGAPIQVNATLKRLESIDPDKKFHFLPGEYARLDHEPMENDTFQRQCALNEASRDADWVIQLDTDEVLGDPAVFSSCLSDADAQGFQSLEYPARWLYRQLGNDRYLEWCSRFWQISAGYPGPVAVRAYTKLHTARRCEGQAYRVDFRATTTNHSVPENSPVHRVVQPAQGINHYSWVREEETLRAKFNSWSHAKDRDWNPDFARWMWCGRHPYLATIFSPFRRGNPMGKHVRIVKIPSPYGVADDARYAERNLVGQSV